MSLESDSGLQFSNKINKNDHGAYVTIAQALLLTSSLFFYGFRISTRWPLAALFKWDDTLVTIAVLLSVGQCVATSFTVQSGLGHHVDQLADDELRKMSNAFYASNVLYIIALCFAKLGCSLLVYRLTRVKGHIFASHAVSILIGTWGVTAITTVAVTCPYFHSYAQTLTCYFESFSRWAAIAAFGVVMEVALLLLPLYLVWDLQVARSTKLIVILAFWSRLPVLILSILRLLALKHALVDDISFSFVPIEVYTQIEMHACIIAATIPCMRPFLKAFNTGYLGTTLVQVDPSGSLSRSGKSSSNVLHTKTAKSTRSSNRSHQQSHFNGLDAISLGPLRPDHANSSVLIEHARRKSDGASAKTDDSGKLIIRKTVDVSVE